MDSVAVDDLPSKDQPTAEWLNSLDVEWEYVPKFELGAISEKASRDIQARLQPFDEDTVDRYTQVYRSGNGLSKFPALIVRKIPRNHVLLAGMHRYSGAKRANKRNHSVFLVKVPDELALRITYEDNMRNGLNLTTEERTRHAVHLCETGWSQSDAARLMGLTNTAVSKARQAHAAVRRAADLRISQTAFSALAPGSRSELMRINSDPVFVEAAKLAIQSEKVIGAAGVKKLVKKVTESRSDANALKVIAAEAESIIPELQKRAGRTNKTRGKAGVVRPAVGRLLPALTAIADIRPRDVAAGLQSPAQGRNIKKEIKETIAHLESIARAL